MVNEDRGQQIDSLSGMLGQMGLGPMPMEYNLDRILELVRSRKITESVLFYYESVNGNQDLLANHFIIHLDSLGKWSDGSWSQKFGDS